MTIWHGEQDRLVPIGHGQRLTELIDGTTLRLSPNDGHLSIFLSNLESVVHDVMV